MPDTTTSKKPKAKKIFYPCKYCNKGLKSAQGRSLHEKFCSLNPANREQKIESDEIAKTIPKETREKMEKELDPLKELKSVSEPKQPEISEKKLTQEEQKQMQHVLNFVHGQRDKQLQTDEKKYQIDSIKQDTNLLRAKKDLQNLEGGSSQIFDKEFQNFLLKLEAMRLTLGNKSQDKNENNMVSEVFKQNQQLQQQQFNMLLDRMKEAKEENNVEKFTKTFESMKKLSQMFGGKETGNFDQIFPPLIELGKKVLAEKQNPQRVINTYPQNNSNPQKEKEQLSTPREGVPEAATITPQPNNPGGPPSAASITPQPAPGGGTSVHGNNPAGYPGPGSNPGHVPRGPSEEELKNYAKSQGYFDDNLETDPNDVISQSLSLGKFNKHKNDR